MTDGDFGGSWWGQRWIEALERLSTAWQNRLPRGRDYAKKGHVISLAVTPGKISARVQGSRSKPYVTTIEVPALRTSDWDRVIKTLASEARFPAQLMVGVMPADIDDAFSLHNVSLFPVRNSELLGSCSCPDKARPCKHIAAVHYAFGQALDRDPFLLFAVRGADRDRLLGGFSRAWFGDEFDRAAGFAALERADAGVHVMPLDADQFNRAIEPVPELSFHPLSSDPALLILERLGAPRSWSLPVPITALLGPVYEDAIKLAQQVAIEELDDTEPRSFDAIFDDDGGSDDGGSDDGAGDDSDDAHDPDGIDEPRAPLSPPTRRPPAHAEFRALPMMAAAAADRPSAPAVALPTSLAISKKIAKPAPPPEEPARSSVIVRKGVATVGRRRRGTPETATETVDRGRPAASVGAPPPDFVPPPESSGPLTVRKGRGDEAGPAVVRRRGAGGITIDGDSPLRRAAQLGELAERFDQAMSSGDFANALRAAVELWADDPTLERFVRLSAASAAADRVDETLRSEAARLAARARDRAASLNAAQALLLLCAGDQKAVIDHVFAVGKRAWRADGPAVVTLVYAIGALTREAGLPAGSVAAEVLGGPDGLGDVVVPGCGTAAMWTQRWIDERPPPPTLDDRLARGARELVLWAVGSPISQEAPGRVARLVAATAEALEIAGAEGGGAGVLAAVRAAAPRRRDLTDALRAAIGASSILG
ncbi:MAG: SWIM zinc finger family protein [Myxococcales bacterium]|nr:SWIM zinc finger family protein [Myxococcales bacterium]MCB9520160.1 SWIM zinc finger family protein [Myxococcales bacterium]MCB9531218.1 SWIM zinc finger family protein [Myxococcales bacterium]